MNEATFYLSEHPELEGMKEGDTIHNIRIADAKITKISGDEISVDVSGAEIESDNSADRALKDMTAKPMMDKAQTADKGGGEEDY